MCSVTDGMNHLSATYLLYKLYSPTTTENPLAVQEHDIHREKIKFWCVIHSEGVLDPIYFNSKTVGKEDHCELFNTYVRKERQNFPKNIYLEKMVHQSTQVDIRVRFLTNLKKTG